jgi:hypothetical protein
MLISYFYMNSVIHELTAGYVTVEQVRRELPRILHDLEADGGTACFDAMQTGLSSLAAFNVVDPGASQRNVLICLTDGDDNGSAGADVESLMQTLQNPGCDNFMFMLMAVDMQPRQTGMPPPSTGLCGCHLLSMYSFVLYFEQRHSARGFG